MSKLTFGTNFGSLEKLAIAQNPNSGKCHNFGLPYMILT